MPLNKDNELNPPDLSSDQPVLWDDPNKYARPARIEIWDDHVVMHGYQEFGLDRNRVTVSEADQSLMRKHELLLPYFTPRYLCRRDVLDLGASAGFYCFLAIQNGAEKATALDMDQVYLDMIGQAADKLGINNIDIAHTNITEWSQPADITVALALVHWIYSCTAVYGTLDSIIGKISSLTKYLSIIEWIEPDDPAIEFFHHTDWNKAYIKGPYNRDEFEGSLLRHFKSYKYIGDVNPTRRIYIAFKTDCEIDLSGPLPLLLGIEAVISSRLLATHGGIEYWSRIYDGGDHIVKQATLDLAAREAQFLKKYDCDYFPRVYETKRKSGYSVIRMEKIKGESLQSQRDRIIRTEGTFYKFIVHCLRILTVLNDRGIIHRDIRMDNIIMRNNKPVLFDFGWAISDDHDYIEPDGLGDEGRPPDNSFCDVYSMGKVIQAINQGKYPLFNAVTDMMTDPDISLRITDLQMLEILFSAAVSEEGSET